MKVGFFQMEPVLLDTEGNVDKALRILEKTNADLMVLPELFHSGYAFKTREEVEKVAESIPGYTVEKLQEVAADKNMVIVAGICEKENETYYNSAVYMTGDAIGIYRKIHLFLNEKKFFSPGNQFYVFDSVGLMICFDYFFCESARTLMLKGARLIAHPSNLILPYCPDVMMLRSLENRIFSVTCNRIGKERGLEFIGKSQIVDSKGNLIYRAGTEEEVVVEDINIKEADKKAITPENRLLEDRDPQAYRIISE